MKKNIICALALLIVIAIFSGCVSKQIYYWGDFEIMTLMYMKGEEERSVQIQRLENIKQEIESSGKPFPPGFNAHLGLLYVETGNRATAISYFEAEKALFPEAAHYMDFTISRTRR